MPWLLPRELERLCSSPSQRECERTSFSFYCAVRDRLPVWTLEDMRSMEVFCWDDGRPRAFLPSEALLYALVHDHGDYARYLLDSFSVSALRPPRCHFCRVGGCGAPHLAVAVRYDRVAILAAMLEALKAHEPPGTRRQYLESRGGGCAHALADASKTAVQLAVELSRADCLLLLLAHGARPDALDAALQRLGAASGAADAAQRRAAHRCLDFLLLFWPGAPPAAARPLQEEPQRWQRLLGKRVFSWLRGLAPPPLLLQALRCLAQSGPDRIASLPDFLLLHA
ncbi:ankyrin repeat domain-containing protein 9 [Nelusetta ayraudi]|uniref:ankyrin repeat domain-containing protein 9 n=1 Tax=Nelusetta ayraudi TaxID=303726 RepID=UPI003F71DCD7